MNGLLFFSGHIQVLMMDRDSTNYRVLQGKGVYGARGDAGTYPPGPRSLRVVAEMLSSFASFVGEMDRCQPSPARLTVAWFMHTPSLQSHTLHITPSANTLDITIDSQCRHTQK